MKYINGAVVVEYWDEDNETLWDPSDPTVSWEHERVMLHGNSWETGINFVSPLFSSPHGRAWGEREGENGRGGRWRERGELRERPLELRTLQLIFLRR